jgi:hypothetical protein
MPVSIWDLLRDEGFNEIYQILFTACVSRGGRPLRFLHIALYCLDNKSGIYAFFYTRPACFSIFIPLFHIVMVGARSFYFLHFL